MPQNPPDFRQRDPAVAGLMAASVKDSQTLISREFDRQFPGQMHQVSQLGRRHFDSSRGLTGASAHCASILSRPDSPLTANTRFIHIPYPTISSILPNTKTTCKAGFYTGASRNPQKTRKPRKYPEPPRSPLAKTTPPVLLWFVWANMAFQ